MFIPEQSDNEKSDNEEKDGEIVNVENESDNEKDEEINNGEDADNEDESEDEGFDDNNIDTSQSKQSLTLPSWDDVVNTYVLTPIYILGDKVHIFENNYHVEIDIAKKWSAGAFDILLYLFSILFLAIGGGTHLISNYLLKFWMNVMERLERKRIIMDRSNKEPYLERYYIFLKDRDNSSFPFNVFIHKFLKSDPDDLHDHPWGYFTFILHGGYYEYVEIESIVHVDGKEEKKSEIHKFWRGPGFYQRVPLGHKHRIELKNNVNAWTLFIPFKIERKWGFFTKHGWKESVEYLEEKEKTKND